MAILILWQRLFGLLSLVAMLFGGWLVGVWFAHRDDYFDTHWAKDDRWLYVGLGLLAWTLLGRWILPILLTRPSGRGGRLERRGPVPVRGDDGAMLRVETYGPLDAPALILTHGWSLDSTIWREAKDQLAGRFRVIVWDLAGLGGSEGRTDGCYSLERMASDLRAVLAYAGGPAVLIGHSIGGMTIQTFCRLYPETLGREVAGVVLENTTYTNPLKTIILSRLLLALRKPLIEPMMRLEIALQPLVWLLNWQSYQSGSTHLAVRLGGFGTWPTRAQLDHTALLVTRNPPAVQAKGNLAMFDWDATDALRTIPVPALVFTGGRDIITKAEAGERIARSAPAARLVQVEKAGHMGPVECAETYNEAIAAFAAEVLQRRSAA